MMIVSQNELRKETVAILNQINKQIEVVAERAEAMRTDPTRLQDHHGDFVMPPLMLAKVTALNTLVLLQAKK